MPPTPPRTPPRKAKIWDPVTVLEIHNPDYSDNFTCLGWADTQGRRCHLPPGAGGQPEVFEVLETLAYHTPNFAGMKKLLSEAAYAGLCGRWHRKPEKVEAQLRYVMRKWEKCISKISDPARESQEKPTSRLRNMSTSEESRNENDLSKAALKFLRGIEAKNITLEAAVQDLERERDQLREALLHESEMKGQLSHQIDKKDRLLKEQVQLEEQRQRVQEENRKREVEKWKTERRQENESHIMQLEAEKKSRQEVERKQHALELRLKSEQKAMAERERELQTANQCVQEEKKEIREHLEKERENRKNFERALAQQQAHCKTLAEVLQSERTALTKLQELHERQREHSLHQKATSGKLKELNYLGQQQYHRLLIAFHSLREGQGQLLKDRDTARGELRRVYQESELGREAETTWNTTKERLHRLISKRKYNH